MDSTTNTWFFLNVYKTETLWELQHSQKSDLLKSVNDSIKQCVDDCKEIYHDVKQDLLIIKLSNGELIPFNLLSDGVRSVLALVLELAFRSYLLNPHLGAQAPKETNGVVLIDELDLHLHPAWQKKVILDIRNAFPCMQFIVTTHSPLVVGSLQDGEIFSIENKKTVNFPIQYGKDANSILVEMGASIMNSEIQSMINSYFILVEGGQGKGKEAKELRKQLEFTLGVNHSELQRADVLLNFF